MKIEKINENQIKCTLTRSDLASRQLKMSELAYGTEKAKSLFQDMMEQANMELGFDADDIPLIIEAIPVSMDCIILTITKVENPDEVDTRFSSLASLKELFGKDMSEEFSASGSQDAESFPDLVQFSNLAKKVLQSSQALSDRLFSFDSLDKVIDFARHIHTIFDGESSLYKSPENDRFYLHLVCGGSPTQDFAHVCGAALEFGTSEPSGYARTAYIREHFEVLLSSTAIRDLAGISAL